MFLAQIILTSPQCIPTDDLQQRILRYMELFLEMTTYQSIRKEEIHYFYVWSIFLPYVKLVYFPEPATGSEAMNKLHKLSQQTALLSLQNMLGRDDHREVLVKESLVDYVTCMPWFLPVGPLRKQAEELVQVVRGEDFQLQPPRLINLTRAKLAKMHFGLEKAVNMSVGEIVSEMSNAVES